MSNKQLGFYVNTSQCSGCKACASACRDKKNLEIGMFYRKVHGFEASKAVASQYYVSLACNHCDNPACVEFCPVNAIIKREEDGVVLIMADKCINCGACLEACPYGVPVQNTAKTKVSKCDFCIDLLAKGDTPACAGACPLGLIKSGEIDSLRKEYGNIADIKGIATSDITGPNVVFTLHMNSMK